MKRNDLCTNYLKNKKIRQEKRKRNDEEANYVRDDRQSGFVLN